MKLAAARTKVAGLVICLALATRAAGQLTAAETSNALECSILGLNVPDWVANAGQWPSTYAYIAKLPAGVVRLGRGLVDFVVLAGPADSRGTVVRLVPRGSWKDAEPTGAAPTNRRYAFYVGNDPAKWCSKIPGHADVVVSAVSSSARLTWRVDGGVPVLEASAERASDLSNLEFECTGVERIVESARALELVTPSGQVRLSRVPVVATALGAEPHWVRRGEDRIALVVPSSGDDGPIVVTWALQWSTFLGGSVGGDIVRRTAAGSASAIVLAGRAGSFDFPTTPGAFDQSFVGGGTQQIDAFVTVLGSDASGLQYSTFLGGSGSDEIRDVAVLPDGRVLAGGWTTSNNFPTTPGVWDAQKQSLEGFIARFSTDGSTLERCTFIGGAGADEVLAIGVALDGDVFAGGDTDSTNGLGITTSTWDPEYAGLIDGLLIRLDADLTTVRWATYIGGSGQERVVDLAVAPEGDVIVGGQTSSPDLQVTSGCFDAVPHDIYLARITGDGQSAKFVTYLGGSGLDIFDRVALFPNEDVAVLATTFSEDYPVTSGAFSPIFLGQQEGVVSRLDAIGQSLIASTFVGGHDYEMLYGLDVSSAGLVTVVGETASQGLAVTPGAFQSAKASASNGTDFLVWQLDPGLSTLVYGTYLGGSSQDGVDETCTIVTTASGSGVLTGLTYSADFPVTPGAIDTSFSPPEDTVVVKLSLLPAGVTRFGEPTPGCTGPLTASATSWPELGGSAFALTCAGAPPGSTRGILVAGSQPLRSPVQAGGAALWVSPASIFGLVPVEADGFGFSKLPVHIPDQPALLGVQVCVQYVWRDSCAPGAWSASQALRLRLGP